MRTPTGGRRNRREKIPLGPNPITWGWKIVQTLEGSLTEERSDEGRMMC